MSKSSSRVSRRRLLQQAAATAGALATASWVFAAPPCASPDASDSSLRASLHYVESSPDPAKKCGACGFFSDPQGSCGKCVIFGGPANVDGHCDSWAARN